MLVSIVVPTYNRAALLDRTLASIVAQSYSDWECIVVDDGSTDGTEAVVAKYAPGVQYVRQTNAGPAAARNRGLERARGDALMFLDSDDVLLPSALDDLVMALECDGAAGVAYGGFHVMHADGHPGLLQEGAELPGGGQSSTLGPAYGLGAAGAILPDLLQHDAVVMGATLIRRSALRTMGTFDTDLRFMEHWEYFLRAAHGGISFVPTRTPVLRIRMHDGNRSQNFEGMLQDRLALIDRYAPLGATALRQAARANAYLGLGMCLCATGQVDASLPHLRNGLGHRPLATNAYDVFTERVCAQALSTEAPAQSLRQLLDALGPSPHARSLKHFSWSRFYRIQAQEREERTQRWQRGPTMGLRWGRSGWHLGRAVQLRPALAQLYAARLSRWLPFSRPTALSS